MSATARVAGSSSVHPAMATKHRIKPKGGPDLRIAAQCIKDKGAAPCRATPSTLNAKASDSEAVIHLELDRMRGHPETRDFLHLKPDVRVEHVIREYASASQKLAVGFEVFERFFEGGARMWDFRGFFGF